MLLNSLSAASVLLTAATQSEADPILSFGNFGIPRIIFSAVVVALGALVYWLVRKFFKRYRGTVDPELKQKRTMMLAIYSLLRFLIFLMVILAILSIFGVNISGAIAGLGIAGAAGALAVQDLLKDLIGGFTIISEKYFAVGDIIDYNGEPCKVVDLTIRSTKIESLKDKSITSLQNHLLSEVKVLSHNVNLLIPLSYDLPVAQAEAVLRRICARAAALECVEDCIYKGANEFKDSCINYLIIFRCDPADVLNTRRAVIRVVQEELEAADIKIPFPQLDVHMDR